MPDFRGSVRRFGALIAHDAVCLVEYVAERTGVRVVNQSIDRQRTTSIDEAVARLATLLSARGARRPRLSIAIENFGVFHHVMALPHVPDRELRSIVTRESERLFGVSDPIVAFTRDIRVFVAGAPRETIDALRSQLGTQDIDVEVVTVVPSAIHSLYRATAAPPEPTAVLACLQGGPHLAFFAAGRLQLAVETLLAPAGERASIEAILDQVELRTMYFRQHFRASPVRMLLSAHTGKFDALAQSLEKRLTVPVSPLFASSLSPDGVVAVGAALEARQEKPLDLYHPPRATTVVDPIRTAMRGPNLVVAGLAAAALVAGVWSAKLVMLTRTSTPKTNVAVAPDTSVSTPSASVADAAAETSPVSDAVAASPIVGDSVVGRDAAAAQSTRVALQSTKPVESRVRPRVAPQPKWHVSATLIVGASRAAIINDVLLSVGDSLPDGVTLTSVERDRVVLTDSRGATYTVVATEGEAKQ